MGSTPFISNFAVDQRGRGLTDAAWPADLAPSRPTLKALVERKIIVRRKRA